MTIFIISALVAVALIFALMKFGKIEDKDGNNIPDVVDEKVKKVKEVAGEVKERAKRVSEEAADVVKAVKEVAKQTKDVVEATKGDKRKGKKINKK
jgi:methyl-accepting chemotaxis protein